MTTLFLLTDLHNLCIVPAFKPYVSKFPGGPYTSLQGIDALVSLPFFVDWDGFCRWRSTRLAPVGTNSSIVTLRLSGTKPRSAPPIGCQKRASAAPPLNRAKEAKRTKAIFCESAFNVTLKV